MELSIFKNGEETSLLRLRNVAFCEDFATNLVSLRLLRRKGILVGQQTSKQLPSRQTKRLSLLSKRKTRPVRPWRYPNRPITNYLLYKTSKFMDKTTSKLCGLDYVASSTWTPWPWRIESPGRPLSGGENQRTLYYGMRCMRLFKDQTPSSKITKEASKSARNTTRNWFSRLWERQPRLLKCYVDYRPVFWFYLGFLSDQSTSGNNLGYFKMAVPDFRKPISYQTRSYWDRQWDTNE